MIKRLNTPQLSAAKQRTGLQSISDLVPRLIRQYELQAELLKRRGEPSKIPSVAMDSSGPSEQSTFAWYE